MTTPGDSLAAQYRGLVCDLDGTVYLGKAPVRYAVDALNAVRDAGIGIIYSTNNASRPPEEVAEQLTRMGLTVADTDVVTSSQAGAAWLTRLVAPGSAVLAVGGEGVALALSRAGFTVVRPDQARAGVSVDGVLQGLGTQVTWEDLAEAAYAVEQGLPWVATNTDRTIPTERGVAPGNGTLIGAVRIASRRDPIVVGKPETPLYELAADVLGTGPAETLAVGDRLDTDITGGNRADMPTLYVMTGVSRPRDVALADGEVRPRFLCVDLRGLHEPYHDAEIRRDAGTHSVTCVDAVVTCDHTGLHPQQAGGHPSRRLRAVVAAAWSARDAGITLPDATEAAWDPVEAWIRGEGTP